MANGKIDKGALNARMEAIRSALGHPHLTSREQRLLAVILTYMPFDFTTWDLSRGRLARHLYGRDTHGNRNNIDTILRGLKDKGFVYVRPNTRGNQSQAAGTFDIDWSRLEHDSQAPMCTEEVPVTVTGTPTSQGDWHPASQDDWQVPVSTTGTPPVTVTGPYSSSSSSYVGPASEPENLAPPSTDASTRASEPDPEWWLDGVWIHAEPYLQDDSYDRLNPAYEHLKKLTSALEADTFIQDLASRHPSDLEPVLEAVLEEMRRIEDLQRKKSS